MPANQLTKSSFLFLLGLVICLNFTGLFNEIMEPDGTIYAALAKQIAKSGNWLFLWVNGIDWLDKPHLPFWLAAISFKIFGYSAFAYKLPSFILFIVSLFYCYRLAAVIYTKETARLATLIYGTALHTIISNFDGKAEIYLTAFVLAAMYHLYRAFESKWLWHIVAAALFAACAAMTKGIFVLITIAVGFVIYWIRTRQWKEFIKPKWYLFVLLFFIFILPELYSLYLQFDLRPEIIVYGKTHVSGLRFFFWDSQFGRFFNNGPITGKGDPSFFLHTTLWAFIPWSIILILAVLGFFRKQKPAEPALQRWIIGGSALFSFMMFTVSKFQLPHYIVILFPHFAMMTAAYLLEGTSEKTLKRINIFQTILFVLVIVMITGIIIIYSFYGAMWFLILLAIIAGITFFYRTDNALLGVAKKNIGFALAVSVFLNCLFYPALLQYQAGMMAGKWLSQQTVKPQVTLYKCLSTSFDFYYNGKTDYSNPDSTAINSMASGDSLYLFSAVHDLEDINTDSVKLTSLKTFPYFHVSQVNSTFINHKTRKNVLDTFAITLVTRKDHLK
jgi:4-amino-4-deoxy-L-arabinose transferase-like glycosyltransferase